MKVTDISQVDKNFSAARTADDEFVWLDCNAAPLEIRGLAMHEDGNFWRLSKDVMTHTREDVAYLGKHTAGGCIRFCTDSKRVAVKVELLGPTMMPHMPLSGISGVDFYARCEDRSAYIGSVMPPDKAETMYQGVVAVAGGFGMPKDPGMTEITINLPLYNGVKNISVGFEPQAMVNAPAPFIFEKPIAYYGSSITQGGCASRPGTCYPSIVSRWLDADCRNFGFSGNALGDIDIATYIASLELSAFVMDYDYNSLSAEHLSATHEPFFKCIRERQPELPVIFITNPNPEREPEHGSNAERFAIIHGTYERALASGDRNVFFVDGTTLFGTADRDGCTVDALHPNDLGFMRMAEHIAPTVKQALGIK